MIKEFGKKGFKEIKKLMEKLKEKGSVLIGKKTCSSLKRRETLP
jgi:F0F1-type ATP synthase gamma subunit